MQVTDLVTHLLELSPASLPYINAHRRSCAAGHPYTVESLRVTTGGIRQCRICDAIRAQQKRDAALAREGRQKFKWHAEHLKTVCKNGHDLTDETNIYVDAKGNRCCRGCRKMANDRITEKRRIALAVRP